MLIISLIPSIPPYNIFKTFTVDSDDIYEAYKYIDTDEYLYREDEGIYSNLGESYKDYYVLEYDTFYALVKKEMPKMISIAEMKELAEKEVKAEKELAKVKFDKDLARYRDKLSKVKPKLMEYIEKCIYNRLKHIFNRRFI